MSAGRTLLLACSGSSKPKQRWFQQREGERREAVLTKYRNGTVKAERGGGRLSFTNDALQIQDLQPEDAGEYVCNGALQARVTVLTGGSAQPGPPAAFMLCVYTCFGFLCEVLYPCLCSQHTQRRAAGLRPPAHLHHLQS